MKINSTRISYSSHPPRARAAVSDHVKAELASSEFPSRSGDSVAPKEKFYAGRLLAGVIGGGALGVLGGIFAGPMVGFALAGSLLAGGAVFSFDGGGASSTRRRAPRVEQQPDERVRKEQTQAEPDRVASGGNRSVSTVERRSEHESEVSPKQAQVIDIGDQFLPGTDLAVKSLSCSGCGAPVSGSGTCGHCGSENLVMANGQIIR